MRNRIWRFHSRAYDCDVTYFQPPRWRFDNHVHAVAFTNTALAAERYRFPVSRGLTGTYNDPRG